MNLTSHSVNQTLDIGKRIGRQLAPSDIVCLYGELGAGKTVLAKGIASALGVEKKKVISPSFVLLRQHQGRVPFYHFDLYRLKSAQQILGLGYEEYFYAQGVSVIEWADRLRYLLPRECLKIELGLKRNCQRQIKISASGRRYAQLLRSLKK